MKKIILFALLVMSLGLAFAELEVDIPFDLDIIGDDFSVVGSYVYESDWITLANIGSTNEDYTLFYGTDSVPTGMFLSVCNTEGVCFIPNSPYLIQLDAGQTLEIHIVVTVNITGGFPFSIVFDEGDLTEPMTFDFTFNTEDNVSADDALLMPEVLSQNFPNPFNPSTTISYDLSQQELASASITIYNTRGQIVRTFNNLNSNGSIVWNGKDNNNNSTSSGMYFMKLKTATYEVSKKMLLIK